MATPENFTPSDNSTNSDRPTVFAAGYLIFRKTDRLEFLLMQHQDRWDLPKGHVDPGESIPEAALRELQEESGIPSEAIWTDPEFTFKSSYWVNKPNKADSKSLKELTIYLGLLVREVQVVCTEHPGFRWWAWNPPHRIETPAIDPLLSFVDAYFGQRPQVYNRFLHHTVRST